jgi:hypothetical protein
MPSHSTHHLQPLDVGVYGPYQTYYGQEVDVETRLSSGILNINKGNFYRILSRARVKTFTLSTITSAWAKAGLIPFCPRVVYSLLPRQHTPDALNGNKSSPISPTTPTTPRTTRKVVKRVIQDSQGSPAKKRARKLSSTVERLIVTNHLLTQQLLDAQKALRNKPPINKKRVPGIGVVSSTDIQKLIEEQQQKTNNKKKDTDRKKKVLATKGSSSQNNIEVEVVEEEVELEEEMVEVEDGAIVVKA